MKISALKADSRMDEQEFLFQNLLEHIFDAVVVVDGSGIIRYVNQAAAKLFGHNQENLVGQSFGFPIIDSNSSEIEILRSDGSQRYGEMKASQLEWMGKPVYLASIRDNTERIQVRKQREQMDAHLQQLQKIEAIGVLAGGIAHDFNNILTPIIGYTEIVIGMVQNDPHIEACLKEVLQAANRAKQLVRQILTFSRQSQNEFQPYFTTKDREKGAADGDQGAAV